MSVTVPSGSASGHLAIAGTYNFRELESCPAGPTHHLRPRKLYRSDALHRLTDGSRAELAGLRITTIIDLRTPEELLRAPSKLDGLDAVVHHLPIFLGSVTSMVDGDITLAAMYRVIILEHGAELVRAIRLIAQSGDAPVLVHCTAGKDRTGLVIALSLLAAGVDEGFVLHDYSRTNGYLAGQWRTDFSAALAAENIPLTPALDELISGSPIALLRDMLRLINSTYGSVPLYLAAHGLTAADAELLRSTLTAHGPADAASAAFTAIPDSTPREDPTA